MSQKHLIGKQVLEIEVGSSSDAYAIQQKLSEFSKKELTSALEKLFDELVDADTMIRLDTIDIDIGSIDVENADFNEITNRIINLLEKTIKDTLESNNAPKEIKKPFDRRQIRQFLDTHSDTFLSKKVLDSERKKANDSTYSKKLGSGDKEPSQRPISQHRRRYYFEAWLHWLEKGVLPSYVIPPEENWMLFVLETLGLDIDAVTMLERKLEKSTIALERLVVQHSSEDLKSISELYTGFSHVQLVKMIEEIELILGEYTSIINKRSAASYRALEIKIWKKVFEIVILRRQKRDSISLGIEVIKHLVLNNVVNEFQLRKIILKKDEHKKEGKDYTILREILKETTIYKEKETRPDEKARGLISKESVEQNLHLEKEVDNVAIEESIEEETLSDEEELESPQYFNNAGMILLHPFLSNFFKKLNLTEKREFKSFETRSKAVLLLHFLATGTAQPKEYDLVLPKFLCEMPANRPLDRTIIITEEEKEEANNLLAVAIEHWGALGGSSPDALREGFLTRQGKLEKESTGWKLYIEQKTMDILLDKLPWNISIIKLPWMKDMLKVEWR